MKSKSIKLQDAISSLLKDKYYFFGEFALFLNYEERNDIETMGVTIDKKSKRFTFLYNNEWVEARTIAELRFLFMHEIFHIISNHIRRVELNEYDPYISNIAQDMLINTLIINETKNDVSVTFVEGGLQLPTEYKGDKIFDEVYKWLLKEQEKNKNEDDSEGAGDSDSNSEGDGKGGAGDSDSEGDGKGGGGKGGKGGKKATKEELEKAIKKALKDPKNYKFDEHFNIDGEVSEQDRHNLVDEIITTLKHRGMVPNNLLKVIDTLDIRKPKTNIFKRLKQSIAQFAKGNLREETYTKLNRRVPMIVKGDKRLSTKFNVLLDTSGSMDGEFKKVLSYLLHATGEFNIIQCDTKIKGTEKIKTLKQLKTNFKVRGGGGTELMPGVNEFRRLKQENVPLIVLTDGYTDDLYLAGFKQVIIVTVGEECKIITKPNNLKQFKLDGKN